VRISELMLGLILSGMFFWGSLFMVPVNWIIDYESIVATKPVWKRGESLKMISTMRISYGDIPLEFNDQLRCIGDEDEIVAVGVFETATKSSEGETIKTPWTWGVIPESTPEDVPCYIRSSQTLTMPFGVKRTRTVNSETFVVSDFDYTQKQGVATDGLGS